MYTRKSDKGTAPSEDSKKPFVQMTLAFCSLFLSPHMRYLKALSSKRNVLNVVVRSLH